MRSGMRWFSTLFGVSILGLAALPQQGGTAGRSWRLIGPMRGVWELPQTMQGKGFLAGTFDMFGGGTLYAFDAMLIDVPSPCLTCIEGTLVGTLDDGIGSGPDYLVTGSYLGSFFSGEGVIEATLSRPSGAAAAGRITGRFGDPSSDELGAFGGRWTIRQ